MNTLYQRLIGTSFVLATLSGVILAQAPSLIPAELASRVAKKFEETKQYSFEGDLEIARRSGAEAPRVVLQTAKVKISVAAAGKSLLRVETAGKPAYVLISDGQTTWEYMPTQKKYTQQDGQIESVASDDTSEKLGLDPDSKRDLAADFTRRVIPILARLGQRVDFADLKGSLLTVISKKDERERQHMVYLTLDIATLTIKKMAWLRTTPAPSGDKAILRSDLTFTSLRVNEPINDGDFTFSPPKGVKRVASLPIPGQPTVTRKGL
jgi:outer membrane lipoprotein-sorting protein